MSTPVFEVRRPGLFTTVQDMGRHGHVASGIVPGGAMDTYALQLANLLVGNQRDEAALEITVAGPRLKVLHDTVIAIGGGDLGAAVDGVYLQPWRSCIVHTGQELSFGSARSGARAYVAVAGGIEVPVILGSKSTYVKAAIGGLEGRALKSGDVLMKGRQQHPSARLSNRRPSHDLIPKYEREVSVRVIPGPDSEAFSADGVEAFFSGKYRVTPQSDRMGYRLDGPAITHLTGPDIISAAALPGTVQVPANGQPMILMADCQTTGGYPRIGSVISVDLPLLAQLSPGASVSFRRISLEEAHTLYREREHNLRLMAIGADVR